VHPPQPAPDPPSCHSNQGPSGRGPKESYGDVGGDDQPDHGPKCRKPEATEGGSRCVECRGISAALGSAQSGLFFALAFVFLDQGGARRKDRREGQEESARDRPE